MGQMPWPNSELKKSQNCIDADGLTAKYSRAVFIASFVMPDFTFNQRITKIDVGISAETTHILAMPSDRNRSYLFHNHYVNIHYNNDLIHNQDNAIPTL
jgi:hypothetical protein